MTAFSFLSAGFLKGARQNFFPEAFFPYPAFRKEAGFFIGPVFMMGEISEKTRMGKRGAE